MAETLPEGKLYIEFFVTAECEMAGSDRYKVIGTSPGNPGDSETWWDQ